MHVSSHEKCKHKVILSWLRTKMAVNISWCNATVNKNNNNRDFISHFANMHKKSGKHLHKIESDQVIITGKYFYRNMFSSGIKFGIPNSQKCHIMFTLHPDERLHS